jgi:cytochrome c
MKSLPLPGVILRASACLFLPATVATAAETYDPRRFEREVLVSQSEDALQFEVLPDGAILFAEFAGAIKRWDPRTRAVVTLGRVPTHAKGEVGLLGMAVAPDFATSGHLYVLFCPAEKQDTMRVSRFTVAGDQMAADSERLLLAWPYDTDHIFHMGGAMSMARNGDLYIGNGDNSHWNPGLPVDPRPGRKSWDSLRSAGNSRDLRGKILRIHPLPGGGYRIPEGNLFPGGRDGAPEVYAMGVRNPFRMTVDDATGTLYFGDVGPNVLPELGLEPAGYEEINATRVAGNFGWPLFIGPNEPYPLYDFERNRPLATFDPRSPRNTSPNNTGITDLPPALPALIWYSTTPSREFPSLGSGGRSILAGPVYHYDSANPSAIKLPEAFDGRLFIYDWMRNWIQTARLGSPGPEVERFLPDLNLRRPIDMKIGPDGALYLIEYGDQWWENKDSRVSRIVYRRGNRPPAARFTASDTAGRAPLALTFDAAGTTDPDGDNLTYSWSAAGRTYQGSRLSLTLDRPGRHEISLTVRDPAGATSVATETVEVGNARPQVRFASPAHGSFFDWDRAIAYQVEVRDPDSATVDPAQVSVRGVFQPRRSDGEGVESLDPGLALMRRSTCFSCHTSTTSSAGPAYELVARKYKFNRPAWDGLARKILTGGTGAWGELPMPPHPQHTIEETRLMLNWILSLRTDEASLPKSGVAGQWPAPARPEEGVRANEGVLILTAGYTDAGAAGAAPLRGESTAVLHSRRKKAALYDVNQGMAYIEQVEGGETGIVGHFQDGNHIVFRDLNLSDIRRVVVRAGGLAGPGGRIELRRQSAQGPVLASVEVPVTGDRPFVEIPAALPAGVGLTDVCVVARGASATLIGLNWIEFQP